MTGASFPCSLSHMVETATKNDRPQAAEGRKLKEARGGRTLAEIAVQILDDNGKPISVQRYQNWEMGKNAPKRKMWPALTKALGVDVTAIYMGKTSAEKPNRSVPVAALRPLIADIRRRLDALEAICGRTAPNKSLHKAGIRKAPKVPTEKQ